MITTAENLTVNSTSYDSYNYQEEDSVDAITVISYILMSVCLFGIPGNGVILKVMSVQPFASKPHSVICKSLAATDLLNVIQGMLFALLYLGWGIVLPRSSRIACKVSIFLVRTVTHLDAWYLASLSLERVLVVYKPLDVSNIISTNRVRILSVFLLVFFLVWNGAKLARFDLVWDEGLNIWNCVPVHDYGLSKVLKIKDVISLLLVNVIPLCIMIPSNIAILVKLYRRYAKRRELGASNLNEDEMVKMTVMFSSVTIVYMVLQSPLTIYTLLYGMKLGKMMFVFRSLEILNASLNFYLYFMSAKLFREKVFEMLGCFEGEKKEKNNIRRKRQRFRQSESGKMQDYSIEIEVRQTIDIKAQVHSLERQAKNISAQGLSEENVPQGPLENQSVDIAAQVHSVDSHGHSVGTDAWGNTLEKEAERNSVDKDITHRDLQR